MGSEMCIRDRCTPRDPKTPAILFTRAKNLMAFSFFSMTSSLNWRFHFDFSDRVFGKNQSHNLHQPARGELVSNTQLNNSWSVMRSVKQVHAMGARLIPVCSTPRLLPSRGGA